MYAHGNAGAEDTGEVGADRPYVVVTVSFRRRLIERWLSARSNERNEWPSWMCRRLGLNVRKRAFSEPSPEYILKVAESGRLSWAGFLALGWGEGEREDEGEELSDRRPEVKRGEYCANMSARRLLQRPRCSVGCGEQRGDGGEIGGEGEYL